MEGNKIDRNTDIDSLRYDRDEYKRKMNMSWEQTALFEEEVIALRNENEILKQKVTNAQLDAQTARQIMTSQIVEFNEHKNSYIEEIQALRSKLQEQLNK
jgi:chromosome segregation ATPase